jgi:hypothetical protein
MRRHKQVGFVMWSQVSKRSIMCKNLPIRALAVSRRIKRLNDNDYVFCGCLPARARHSSSILLRK